MLLETFGRSNIRRFDLWDLDDRCPAWDTSAIENKKVSIWPELGTYGCGIPILNEHSAYIGKLGGLRLGIYPSTESQHWHLVFQVRKRRACSVQPFRITLIDLGITDAVEHLTGRFGCTEREATWHRCDAEASGPNPFAPLREPPPTPGRRGVVYFVQPGPGMPIKIGFTADLTGRLKSLQTASPTPLVLLATIKATTTAEARLHKRFSSLRMQGEWFRPEAELLAYIASLELAPVAV